MSEYLPLGLAALGLPHSPAKRFVCFFLKKKDVAGCNMGVRASVFVCMNIFEKISRHYYWLWGRFVSVGRDTGLEGARFLSFRREYLSFTDLGIDIFERVIFRFGRIVLCVRQVGRDLREDALSRLGIAGMILPSECLVGQRSFCGWRLPEGGVVAWYLRMYPFAAAGGVLVPNFEGVLFFPFGYEYDGKVCYGGGFPASPVIFVPGSGEVVFDADWRPVVPYSTEYLAAYYMNSGNREIVLDDLVNYYPPSERGKEKIVTLQQSRRAAVNYSNFGVSVKKINNDGD